MSAGSAARAIVVRRRAASGVGLGLCVRGMNAAYKRHPIQRPHINALILYGAR